MIENNTTRRTGPLLSKTTNESTRRTGPLSSKINNESTRRTGYLSSKESNKRNVFGWEHYFFYLLPIAIFIYSMYLTKKSRMAVEEVTNNESKYPPSLPKTNSGLSSLLELDLPLPKTNSELFPLYELSSKRLGIPLSETNYKLSSKILGPHLPNLKNITPVTATSSSQMSIYDPHKPIRSGFKKLNTETSSDEYALATASLTGGVFVAYVGYKKLKNKAEEKTNIVSETNHGIAEEKTNIVSGMNQGIANDELLFQMLYNEEFIDQTTIDCVEADKSANNNMKPKP